MKTLNITRETILPPNPFFQRVIEALSGGATLDEPNIPEDTEIPGGAPLSFDASTRLAKLCKVAELTANASNSATNYQVKKGHFLYPGMSVRLAGGTDRNISSIDRSNVEYDTVTTDVTIGVAASGGALLFVNDDGFNDPKGLLHVGVTVFPGSTLSVVLRGTVYARRVPFIAQAVRTKLPNIQFSESF